MKKIYFIEGLPGSGKTTMARRLSKYLESTNEDVVIYNEGDLHPVDLA
jgi:thymidylate kinase